MESQARERLNRAVFRASQSVKSPFGFSAVRTSLTAFQGCWTGNRLTPRNDDVEASLRPLLAL